MDGNLAGLNDHLAARYPNGARRTAGEQYNALQADIAEAKREGRKIIAALLKKHDLTLDSNALLGLDNDIDDLTHELRSALAEEAGI